MPDPATDPRASNQEDLEKQVNDLLSDAMGSVQEMGRDLDEPAPEQQTPDQGEPGGAQADAESESGDARSDAPAPDASADDGARVGAEDVQSALEDAVAEEESPDQPEPEAEAPSGTEPDSEPSDGASEETPSSMPSGYGDVDSLDDELAALASECLEDEGEGDESEPGPEPAGEQEEPISPAPSGAPPTDDDLGDSEGEGEATSEPTGAPSEPSTPAREPGASPSPVGEGSAARESAAPGRSGWLGPKPDWPEVYSRWRPVIIAWRHIAWIVPPLARLAWARSVDGARASEPWLRHGAAVVASPLSRRDKSVRSAVGWLSIWTLFWAACLWVYVLVGRSPAVPEVDRAPTTLAGETAVASGESAP